MSDANYYMLRPGKVLEEIDFGKQLSMEFVHVFEGIFSWIPGNTAAEVARRIGEYARNRGVKIALYVGANSLTAPHFDYYAKDEFHPGWKILDEKGQRGAYCWGSDDFTRWFTDRLIEASLNFNFRMANFDFLAIAPCYNPHHGHAPGAKGLYHQVLNLVRCLDTVRASVPGYVFDSNLGWPPQVPKIARSMDAFYLTDPHFEAYFPSLNATETLDNSRRFQMVSYLLNHLTPVEYFDNAEYFIVPDSVIPDSNIFEYGILQGLAVTPNLQLWDARALFERTGSADQERFRRFLACWSDFVKTNWDYYANTIVVTGPPEVGRVEIYAHAKEDRSFVFLVNPNPFPREASFRLDSFIGLSGPGPYTIHELYPEDQLLIGAQGLEAKAGEWFRSTVPSRTVRVFEISPVEFATRPLRIAGAPATYDRFADHYRVRLEGWQGEDRPVHLFLPESEQISRVEMNGIPLATKRDLGGAEVSVQFPKQQNEEHILRWMLRHTIFEEGSKAQVWNSPANGPVVLFPQLESTVPAANFLGARIENLLNERYPCELLVYFEPGKNPEPSPTRSSSPESPGAPPVSRLDQEGSEWWYTARFSLAFVQQYIPLGPNQQNYVSLNFRNPQAVKEVKAWLNGKETRVDTFSYWRGPAWALNYYLNGSRAGLKRGENVLTLFVQYKSGEANPAPGK